MEKRCSDIPRKVAGRTHVKESSVRVQSVTGTHTHTQVPSSTGLAVFLPDLPTSFPIALLPLFPPLFLIPFLLVRYPWTCKEPSPHVSHFLLSDSVLSFLSSLHRLSQPPRNGSLRYSRPKPNDVSLPHTCNWRGELWLGASLTVHYCVIVSTQIKLYSPSWSAISRQYTSHLRDSLWSSSLRFLSFYMNTKNSIYKE